MHMRSGFWTLTVVQESGRVPVTEAHCHHHAPPCIRWPLHEETMVLLAARPFFHLKATLPPSVDTTLLMNKRQPLMH
jgi:hypothetical protein